MDKDVTKNTDKSGRELHMGPHIMDRMCDMVGVTPQLDSSCYGTPYRGR